MVLPSPDTRRDLCSTAVAAQGLLSSGLWLGSAERGDVDAQPPYK